MGTPRHGHACDNRQSRTYTIWKGMCQRCLNPTSRGYSRYGGRGIGLDQRWERFENFLADMGEAPIDLSIERKNNDGPYCKSNCEWATRSTQQRNTRRSKTFEVDGVVLNVCEIEQMLGLSQGTIWHRLKLGWSSERATTTRKQS